MGRSLFVLATFAVVLGAGVCWWPLHTSAHHADESDQVRETARADSTRTSERDNNAQKSGKTAVTPVLLASAQSDSTASSPLPAKVVPGFPPAPTAEITNEQIAASIKQASLLRSQSRLAEARDLLSDTYLNHRLTGEQRKKLADELEPLVWEVMRTRSVVSDGLVYEVQPGDTLGKLSKPFRVPAEFIMRVNGLTNPRAIRPRQTLRFVEGPFDILTEPAPFELTVLHRGKFVRRFRIGIGKDETPTPSGLYTVNDKQIDPIKWPDPVDRRKIPGGDPANPLGSRWIGIGLGYGIHGTNEPDTIGQKASRGCIRMRNEDVEELFDMVVEGSRVLIR